MKVDLLYLVVAVVLGAVDSIEGLVDLLVVLLDGSGGALGDQLQGENLLVASSGLGRGAARVAGRVGVGGPAGDWVLSGEESWVGHCSGLGWLRSFSGG